ncbi:MAG TPA: hypothetical protein PLV39_13460 [Fimbriimonadaceae bacterium]|jgi:hypothetical protein|nr:hypothetical protein [Fimbriimonadaceae bacterium]
MNLADLFKRRAPDVQAPVEPVESGPSADDVQFVQNLLDRAAETTADAFAAGLLAENRITPAETAGWRNALLSAMRADGGGKIAASATGAVLEGPMSASVRNLGTSRPAHSLTNPVLETAPSGSVLVPDVGQESQAARDMVLKAYRSTGGFGGDA